MEISSAAALEKELELLSLKSYEQKEEIRQHFNGVIESFKPANLLKSAVSNIAHHPGIASAAIGTTAGVGAGVLSRKIIVGKSNSVLKKILGTVVEFAVARSITNNSGFIAEKGIGFLKTLSKRMSAKKL